MASDIEDKELMRNFPQIIFIKSLANGSPCRIINITVQKFFATFDFLSGCGKTMFGCSGNIESSVSFSLISE